MVTLLPIFSVRNNLNTSFIVHLMNITPMVFSIINSLGEMMLTNKKPYF